MKQNAAAHLFSFPFWIFIDRRSPPSIETVKYGGARIRSYPPFRSAKNNWTPMPVIDPNKIPFLKNMRPKAFPANDHIISMSAAVIPVLKVDWTEGQGASLRPCFGKGDELNPSGIGFPMDSLRIDVIANNHNNLSSINEMQFTTLLMRNLRVQTGQWWITRSSDSIQGWASHTIPINSDGSPIALSEPRMSGRTVAGFEVPITNAIWKSSIHNASSGIEPTLYSELYLDAYYFHATTDFRRMTLDAANACEFLKESVIEKLWSNENNGKYRRGKILQGYDMPSHLDVAMKVLCGRSLKDEDETCYKRIKNLWDARGNVAHAKDAYYRNETGDAALITIDNSQELLIGARSCIAWLESLAS